jgi:hemerythrin
MGDKLLRTRAAVNRAAGFADSAASSAESADTFHRGAQQQKREHATSETRGRHIMAFIVWNDRLSVHVASIDGEHKELISILNNLYDAIARGAGHGIVSETLARLNRYTEHHFRHEEALFAQTGYPGSASHVAQHADMVNWLAQWQRRCDSGDLSALSLEVITYLKDWLFDHILGSDHQYVRYLHAAGIE